MDGKFRLADTVVHEDSKDAFFAVEKNRYKGFEIIKIIYSDNFTRARVVTAVDTDFLMPGFGKRPVTIPLTTFWKYDQGQWWWYVKPRTEGVETPFGMMKPGSAEADSSPWVRLKNMPTVEQIAAQVKVSKTTVQLNPPEASSDEVVVTNHMPGLIKLTFTTEAVDGYEAKLDTGQLGPGKSATIRFRWEAGKPKPARPPRATLQIQPLNRVIPIQVTFSPPPPKAGRSQQH